MLYSFLIAHSVLGAVYSLHLVYTHVAGPTVSLTYGPKSRSRAQQLRIVPILSNLLFIVAFVCTLITWKKNSERGNQAIPPSKACREEFSINPDLGGVGALLALMLPSFLIIFVLILGHLKPETSGAKEVCLAQVGNLSALSLNLAISLGRNTLKYPEFLIVSCCIDAVSASISMAFADKDVLAARKLLQVGFLVQIAAFVAQIAGVARFSREPYMCASAMPGYLFPREVSGLSITNLVFRCIAATSPGPATLEISSLLNRVENKDKDNKSMAVKAKEAWNTLPATLFTSHWIFIPHILLNGVFLVIFIREASRISGKPVKLWSEWGQSYSLVVALYAVFHVLYGISRLFTTDALEKRQQIMKKHGTSSRYLNKLKSTLPFPPWKSFLQRWPLSQVHTNYVDHLLVDRSELLSIFNPPKILDEQQLEILDQELQQGFSLNDQEGILDSLQRGARIDRPNDN
ncbi:hypothetical protein DM02DRAFT_727526, partial [Periconia macrospinosa]